MSNKVIFDSSASEGLKKGMDIVYKAVSGTLGAAGRNVIYNEYGRPISTNDGVSIAGAINLEDETESMGAELIKQAAKRTDEEAGDGTSTAIILAHGMVEEGMTQIALGVNPMQLKREMEAGLKVVIEELKAKSRPVESDEDLFNIANISVENPEIATLVRDAAKHAGIEGQVTVDESTGITIEKVNVDGMKFERGYISPYMVTDPEKMEAVMKDVLILVSDKSLNMVNDIFPLWEEINKRGHSQMLLISEDVSGELLASVIATRVQGKNHFLTCCVKKPFHEDFLEDIAVLTGATTLTSQKGIKQFLPEHFSYLGKAQKVVVTKDTCLIIGGAGDKAKIEERIAGIKNEMKEVETFEKNQLKVRLARLLGGVVVIKVGAPTEAEMKYLKRKIEDAVNATRAAMEEGIVVGGGRTMYDISLMPSKTAGETVIRKACGRLIQKIISNAGASPTILGQLKEGEVFNALTGKISTNPVADGIIDPLKVERCALSNAVSFASMFLTTHAAIVHIPEPTEKSE